MTQYNYVVIGAGSAGCVVANRLTEDGETTVLSPLHLPLFCHSPKTFAISEL
jgi:succinate dehydrogenase/fumarate reductase flavoprotein subunit